MFDKWELIAWVVAAIIGLVIVIYIATGCAIKAGPVELEIWDTASLEIDIGIFDSRLCLGCYEVTDPNG